MDRIWKWVMHLNAKLFCLLAAAGFFAVVAWCGFSYITPPEPFKDGNGGKAEFSDGWELSVLDFVSNQLSADTLAIPIDPFRPTIEAIFTNELERAAFLKALRAAQAGAAGVAGVGGKDGGKGGAKKDDPFAELRKKDAVPGAKTAPDGTPLVEPELSYMGYMKRPDGTEAAVFYDSVEKTTVFYDAGKQVHGVDIVSAGLSEAQVKMADGTVQKVSLGGKVTLPPEPVKKPAAVTPAAGGKQAAAGGKQAAAGGKGGGRQGGRGGRQQKK